MSRDEIIRKGQSAESLLGNDVLNEAFANIKNDVFARWTQSGEAQQSERESLYRYYRISDAVKRELERFVAEGKQAQRDIDTENTRRTAIDQFRKDTAKQLDIPEEVIRHYEGMP